MTAKAVRGEDGRVGKLLSVSCDITDPRVALDEQIETADRLQFVREAAQAGK